VGLAYIACKADSSGRLGARPGTCGSCVHPQCMPGRPSACQVGPASHLQPASAPAACQPAPAAAPRPRRTARPAARRRRRQWPAAAAAGPAAPCGQAPGASRRPAAPEAPACSSSSSSSSGCSHVKHLRLAPAHWDNEQCQKQPAVPWRLCSGGGSSTASRCQGRPQPGPLPLWQPICRQRCCSPSAGSAVARSHTATTPSQGDGTTAWTSPTRHDQRTCNMHLCNSSSRHASHSPSAGSLWGSVTQSHLQAAPGAQLRSNYSSPNISRKHQQAGVGAGVPTASRGAEEASQQPAMHSPPPPPQPQPTCRWRSDAPPWR
jgi:hypothetical protein